MNKKQRILVTFFIAIACMLCPAFSINANAASKGPIKEVKVLNANEKKLEKRIVKAARNYQKRIDVSDLKINVKNLENLVWYMHHTDLDLFCVNEWLYWTVGKDVVAIELKYNVSKSKMEKERKQLNKEIDKFAKTVDKNMSDVEKALYISEYLVSNVYYEHKNYKRQRAYDALVLGKGKCAEYACAYKALADKIGLKTCIITSKKIDHAWVLVKIGGKYYHVDPTWMDSDVDSHNTRNFLKSNYVIQGDHNAKDMKVFATEKNIKIGNEFDNLFGDGRNTHWAYSKGYWYASDNSDKTINKYKFNKNTFECVEVIETQGMDCYQPCVAEYKGLIYYTRSYYYSDPADEGIYCYNPETKEISLVLAYQPEKYNTASGTSSGFTDICIDKNGNMTGTVLLEGEGFKKTDILMKLK